MYRLVVFLLTGLLILSGMLWLGYENSNLGRSLEKANHIASEQKATIAILKDQITAATIRADKNERAQIALREKLNAAGEREAQKQKIITRLLNENKTFQHWYSTDLPEPVRQLHQRPACASAGSCLQQLPESHSLPDAGKRPQN